MYSRVGGGNDTAILTGSGSGTNIATLYADGSGELKDPAAGYTVTVTGTATIHVNGHAGDASQFYDSPGAPGTPGRDTFYAYADYGGAPGTPGHGQLAGMYGSGYSNSASGFGTNIGYSTNGGSDMAVFFGPPGSTRTRSMPTRTTKTVVS